MRNNTANIHKKKFILPFILTVLISLLFLPVDAAKKQCVWTGVEKIVAVGDVHGAYDNFVKILKGFGIIDENLHWIGGNTHLVQAGDIMDRGPKAKDALDLLMRLEEEAEQADGKVHLLLGNHEEMNITGISLDYVGYVTVEQFVSFLPEKFKLKKEMEFRKKAGRKTQDQANLDLSSDEDLRKFWENLLRNDSHGRRTYVSNFNDKYGKWLIDHNAVIKINDIIFCHGGISRDFSTWKLEDMNDLLRRELTYFRTMAKRPDLKQRPFSPRIVYQTDGPLWYRGFALMDEESFNGEVDEILKNLNANYMVIAHTPQTGSPTFGNNELSRFQKRIWIIDTGISHFPGGKLAGLIIENGKLRLEEVVNEK